MQGHLELMRDPARDFPAVADPAGVRSATVWHCRYKTLAPLAALPALAHLELLGICPPDKSLGTIEKCKHLRTARIAHYPRAEIERFFSTTAVANQFNPDPMGESGSI
jgi:hypothetical protein